MASVELSAGDLRARLQAATGELVDRIERLPGGASGLTYLATIGTQRRQVVVKVAPRGLPAVKNRDVLRQARILRLLQDAPGVRVPTVLAEDPGTSLDDPPLFVMAHVGGDSIEPLQEDRRDVTIAQVNGRARQAVEMLADLHAWSLPPGVRAEPSIPLTEEIERWDRAFASVPDDLRAGAGACRDALTATTPADAATVVVHGDWRLGNMLCRDSDVCAVIDWEIWSLGDPRADLAWLLLAMDPAHPHAHAAHPDIVGPEALLAVYEGRRGPVADIAWFLALQRFKQAAIIALLMKNARKRGGADHFAATYGPIVPRLLEWCRHELA